MLERHQVISRLLGLFDRPSYLEIGVNHGHTFNQVQATSKVAVDPRFMFDVAAYSSDSTCTFHQITSDKFFSEIAGGLPLFEVIYLDGLHTFEQTLRDLLNAFSFLSEGGIIVVDDVLPNSFDASLPDIDQAFKLRGLSSSLAVNWHSDGSWMGDVFKVIFFLETFLPQFSFATVEENHGQTVVWRETRPTQTIALRTAEQIARMDYRDTLLERKCFNVRPFEEIIAGIGRKRLITAGAPTW